MAKRKYKNGFTDEIRAAVDASGLSRYRIALTIGIDHSTMSRFMSGGMLGRENLDALAKLLDLHVSRGPGFGKSTGKES